ncbi:MAG: amidohydrolase [Thermofilaceae archaeon]|nr:amidohydrolase [Thermofilaceae archaeon]
MRSLAVIGRVLEKFDERGRPVWHEGMLVEDGVVSYLGPEPESRASRGVDVIRVETGVVLPGFTDSHAHVAHLGLSLDMLDLRNVNSIEELKRLVSAKAKELGPGRWILGRGWDQELFKEGRWPNRHDLDEAAPRNPVLLVRVCGHAAVANTLALSLTGIDDSTPDPPGGLIEKREGKITGVLKEAAVGLISSFVRREGLEKHVVKAQEALLSSGVTCVHAMSVDERELEALSKLASEGKLRVRIRSYIDFSVPQFDFIKTGFLNIVGLKVFVDGSFGARTASLREPYADDPSTNGILLMSSNEIAKALLRAEKLGLQLAVHAIGDKALEEVVSAAKSSKGGVRVEHASLAPPDLIEELSELSLPVSTQPRFVLSDWWIVSRLGRERTRWAYPFKSFLTHAIPVSFSSDAPVEPCNPWEGVYAAVTRGRWEGLEIARITSSEVLSVEEAIRCYTETGPKILGENLGKLSVGCPADFVIVDRDPFKVPERELRNVRVLATYVEGVEVYRTQGSHLHP